MKNCGNEVKHTCAEKNYATCISYETPVPAFSGLTRITCRTLEETTEDLYDILGGVKEEINFQYETCLNPGNMEPRKVKEVLLKYEQEICLLKARVLVLESVNICDIDITGCIPPLLNIPCGTPITTLGDLLNHLLT